MVSQDSGQPTDSQILQITVDMFACQTMYEWYWQSQNLSISGLRAKCRAWLINESSWDIQTDTRFMTKIVYTLMTRFGMEDEGSSKFSTGTRKAEAVFSLLTNPQQEELIMSYAPAPQPAPIPAEIPSMAPAVGFETRHYFNGMLIESMSDDNIVHYITQLEDKVVSLLSVRAESKGVKRIIKQLNKDIKQLVKHLDKRG